MCRKNSPSSTAFFQEFESQFSMGKLGNKLFSSENESNVKEKSSPGIQELNHFFKGYIINFYDENYLETKKIIKIILGSSLKLN